MRKILVGIALASTLLLSGCDTPEPVAERRITVEVTYVKLSSKSNSKVDLRDVKTGRGYYGKRLSCSKSKAANVKIGSLWDVTEVDYVYSESKKRYSDIVGTQAICTYSN